MGPRRGRGQRGAHQAGPVPGTGGSSARCGCGDVGVGGWHGRAQCARCPHGGHRGAARPPGTVPSGGRARGGARDGHVPALTCRSRTRGASRLHTPRPGAPRGPPRGLGPPVWGERGSPAAPPAQQLPAWGPVPSQLSCPVPAAVVPPAGAGGCAGARRAAAGRPCSLSPAASHRGSRPS